MSGARPRPSRNLQFIWVSLQVQYVLLLSDITCTCNRFVKFATFNSRGFTRKFLAGRKKEAQIELGSINDRPCVQSAEVKQLADREELQPRNLLLRYKTQSRVDVMYISLNARRLGVSRAFKLRNLICGLRYSPLPLCSRKMQQAFPIAASSSLAKTRMRFEFYRVTNAETKPRLLSENIRDQCADEFRNNSSISDIFKWYFSVVVTYVHTCQYVHAKQKFFQIFHSGPNRLFISRASTKNVYSV